MFTFITDRTAAPDMPTSGCYLDGDAESRIPYEDGASPDILRVASRHALEAWVGDRSSVCETVRVHDRGGDFLATAYIWVPAGPRYRTVTVFGAGPTRQEQWLHLRGLVVLPEDAGSAARAAAKMAARPAFI